MDKKQRLTLRSIGQKLQDLVFIGKDGISENVLTQIRDNLYAHELIKIKVQQNVSYDIFEFAKVIEDKCGCEVVCVIGSKILLYKYSNNPKIKNHVI